MNLVGAYLIGIALIVLFWKIFSFPFKIFLKCIYNAIIGGIIILVINFVGNFFNFHITMNFLNALIIGFLGIPGVIMYFIMKYWM